MPLVVGIIAVLVLVGAGIGVYAATRSGSAPTSGPSHPRSSSPPGPVQSSTPPPGPLILSALMPTDLDLGSDCTSATTAGDAGITGFSQAYTCTEPGASTISGANVKAYLFGDSGSRDDSVTAFNSDVKFDTDSADNLASCPPTSGHNGTLTWGVASSTNLGTLECYLSSKQTCVYMWTDDNDLTMFIVEGVADQSCDDVQAWWEGQTGSGD